MGIALLCAADFGEGSRAMSLWTVGGNQELPGWIFQRDSWFSLQSLIGSNTLVILSIYQISFKSQSLISMFFLFFFVLGFQLHFFPLRSRFDAFHFLDSQKNRRVWRPVQLGQNFGKLLFLPGCFGSWHWRFWGTERGLKRCGHP